MARLAIDSPLHSGHQSCWPHRDVQRLPQGGPAAQETLESLLDPKDADTWNSSLARACEISDFDKEVYDAAVEQTERGLLSKPMSKEELDDLFGKGGWKAIRRRGINQHGKCRGIDNACSSKTNFAAWLEDTIATPPRDIGVQILCWLF